MQFVSTDAELSFEMTLDSPSLFVGLSVYDDSGPTPVLLSTTQMINVVGNMYRGKFTPTFGKTYLIYKAVYTDVLLNVLNTDYNSGSESVVCGKSTIMDGQIIVRKNKPLNAFTFVMVDVVNQNPAPGLTVLGRRSKDGLAFANLDNPVVEIGNGFYKINFTANDLNADVIGLDFYALGADNTVLTMLTQV